ncbi:MAG: glutamine-hydrolyzing GMP synthase [Candidatus Wildermuthbacteria bacterium RIFCSPHIGHO2_01_FULL_45_20]|uniref:GMP synthase [glutamine-hydrolyzing] n=1 Tax=Candidatus Wildermuthbacteria bacterium RIFCSPHIGHO2_02_FULL_45_25 TaxID=1802450 RepID=A0A1G2R4G9_9BACT|nr:MAG: glutamine-hydrolyzing GMP synthase [Candidatus Wildermuthbacteria bacterium RIFCSPHIGHO2_01_FULL_45_20]OHA67142.1 MAG: glutamine-hydrolyzing GMP synthase [Candidatus Wildermuthbacteria bacterium RIFCSPHIGHO2_02_FULL_45_25]
MPHSSSKDTDIIILDFGSQYSTLILRRLRSIGIAAKLLPHDTSLSTLRQAKGIILSGGPDSVYKKGAATLSVKVFDLGIPVLGICYGMQLMAQMLGGLVEKSDKREYGSSRISITHPKGIFHGLPKQFTVWMSHGDYVTKLPKGFIRSATTANSPDAAISHPAKKLFGIQFHPEVEHTQHGNDILKNFVIHICEYAPSQSISNLIDRKVQEIRNKVGNQHVICAVSGGVDSSVVAALIAKAIGDQLTCIFVNSGTLRKNEPKQALNLLKNLGLNITYIHAETQFLRALKGATFGETKRKIIGKEFIRVFEKSANAIKPKPIFLAQGTIHSDVVESARTDTGKKTHAIKSHHNVGGLPKRLNLTLLEPLRDLFKDEVRALGEALGMPESAVWRQPFPGPGLAIRVVGEVTKQKLDILREADAIVREEIENKKWQNKFFQYFAILLSEKTVGVTGDQRNYAYPIVVKAIISSDVMTYQWAPLPHKFLAHVSERITNEVHGVARVLYDITSKPPGTVEWE